MTANGTTKAALVPFINDSSAICCFSSPFYMAFAKKGLWFQSQSLSENKGEHTSGTTKSLMVDFYILKKSFKCLVLSLGLKKLVKASWDCFFDATSVEERR